MGIAGDIALILVAALLGGVVARALGLPLILGYIVAGVLVGPNTGGPTVGDIHEIELLAEIGVALLLFAIGLHFSLGELAPVRRVALLGTTLQILLTIALGYGIAYFLGLGWVEAVWFGALIALSSTAVVLKTLSEGGVLNTLASRVIIGMLLVQDLAVVPLLTLLPALNDIGEGLPQVGFALLKAGLFIAGMLVLGTRVLPPFLARVAGWNSRELFLIAVVAVGLGVGYATYLFGLSFAFGAFIAGMVLSQSDYSHQALAEVSPLRDVFAMLFFVSVGLLIDVRFMLENWATILAVVAAVCVGKAFIFAGITRSFGYGNIAPFAVGLGLFQVGEFSFLIARVGVDSGAVSSGTYSIVLATAAVTMALTPIAARLAPVLYGWWRERFPREVLQTFDLPEKGLEEHVVIVGYGRVGSFVARLLDRLGQPFVIVDINPGKVEAAREAGLPVVFGDAAAEPVLEAASVPEARLVILAVPDAAATRLLVERVHSLNPKARIVVRSASPEQLEDLGSLGVYEAVQPEFEAGIELGRQALIHLGFGAEEIQRFSDGIRHELYAPIANAASGAEGDETSNLLNQMREASRLIQTGWVRLGENSPLAGRTIGEMEVRRRTGASIVAVLRDQTVMPSPGPETTLYPGDTVGILGTPDQRAAFRSLEEEGT